MFSKASNQLGDENLDSNRNMVVSRLNLEKNLPDGVELKLALNALSTLQGSSSAKLAKEGAKQAQR
jgi:hypothetical protein